LSRRRADREDGDVARHNPRNGKPDPKLAEELFALVEEDQGYAFISDGIEVLSKKEILWLARASLKHTKIVVNRLEKFIYRYSG